MNSVSLDWFAFANICVKPYTFAKDNEQLLIGLGRLRKYKCKSIHLRTWHWTAPHLTGSHLCKAYTFANDNEQLLIWRARLRKYMCESIHLRKWQWTEPQALYKPSLYDVMVPGLVLLNGCSVNSLSFDWLTLITAWNSFSSDWLTWVSGVNSFSFACWGEEYAINN